MHRLGRVVAALLLAAPAAAQERPPQGIGFAQASAGTWLCRHEEPEEALACARELCAEQAAGEECWPVAWCYPANWSGLMVVSLADIEGTQVLCGAPSEKALTDALAAFCASDEQATRCEISLIVDPEGNERTVSIVFEGPATAAAAIEAEGSGEAFEPAAE